MRTRECEFPRHLLAVPWLLLPLLLVAGVALADGPAGASAVEGGELIAGIVIDESTGEGIAGAVIGVSASSETAVTGSAGRFRLRTGRDRPAEIVIIATGYLPRRIAFGGTSAEERRAMSIALKPTTLDYQEHLVVTATRTRTPLSQVPSSMSILDHRDLSTTPTFSLVDVLDLVPGLHGRSNSGNPLDASLDARGFAGSGLSGYLLVLVDGVPVNDMESGCMDWNMLPLDRVQHAEVRRGPGSALWGDTGLGGVVHLFTGPAEPRPTTSLSLDAGSFGEWRGTLGHAGGDESFSYDFSVSSREVDGYRDRSASTIQNLDAKFRIALGKDWSASIQALGSLQELESPGPLTAEQLRADRSQAAYPFDGWERDRYSIATTFAYSRSADLTARFDISHRSKLSEQILTYPIELQMGDMLIPGQDVQHKELDTRTTAVQAQVDWLPGGQRSRHRLSAGVEASIGDLDVGYRAVSETGDVDSVPASDGSGDRRLTAFFLQDQIAATPKLSVLLGVRYDRFDDEFVERIADARGFASDNDALSPQAGLTWSYTPQARLFVQAGRGFRSPTMEQLFDQRRFFGTSFSNEALSPQRAKSYEIGWNALFRDKLDLQASLFRIDVRDEIDFDPATFRYSNIGRSRHDGLEVAASARLRPRLDAFFSYTLLDVTHREGPESGNQIAFVPRHIGAAGVRYGATTGWRGSLVARYTGREYLDDFESSVLESRTIVDGQLGYRWPAVELFLAGSNLFDEEYATNAFLVPRAVLVPGPGLPPTTVSYPAPPRSVRAGVRLRIDHAR